MSQGNHQTTSVLNDLIATCNDSWEGFGRAAKGAHSDNLRSRLTDISLQRAGFARRLADEVKKLGGEPAEAGHGGGVLHQGWVDLETDVKHKDDAVLQMACRQGEESTLKHFEQALENNMADELRLIVERQFNEVRDTVKELKDQVGNAPPLKGTQRAAAAE